MKKHLNWDGRQNNGIIFNDTYTRGALFVGAEHKPKLSFEYDSMQYSEVHDGLDYVEFNGVKKVMDLAQADEVRLLAGTWVQPLGQEGNPTPEQIQEQENSKHRAYLASTDWYVVRLQETSKAIPSEIITARQAARDAIV